MRLRYKIFIICFVFSINVFGQQANKTTLQSLNQQVQDVCDSLESTNNELLKLYESMTAIHLQIQSINKEVALYREDVRSEISKMHNSMSEWLTLLSIVIGIIAAALGVAAPIYLNNRNNKEQKEKLAEIGKALCA